MTFDLELRGDFLRVRLIHVMIALAGGRERGAANTAREFVLTILRHEDARRVRRSVVGGGRGRGGRVSRRGYRRGIGRRRGMIGSREWHRIWREKVKTVQIFFIIHTKQHRTRNHQVN